MSRTYSVKLVALTIGAPIKWVDNLLSHHPLPGVASSRQGVERRITDEGLLAIEIVRILAYEVGLGIAAAVDIARSALATRISGEMRFTTGAGVALLFPVAEIERRLRERMVEAIEAVAHVPRGRPRRAS